MPKRALFLFTAALCLAAPIAAQAEDTLEAWTPTDSSIRASAAGISLPHSIATLSLTKSGEASNGGRGIDNYAQYVSQDGAVQATRRLHPPRQGEGQRRQQSRRQAQRGLVLIPFRFLLTKTVPWMPDLLYLVQDFRSPEDLPKADLIYQTWKKPPSVLFSRIELLAWRIVLSRNFR